MTLAQFLEEHPDVFMKDIKRGCVIVYAHDPALWHLEDYFVSTVAGVDNVYLCKRLVPNPATT